MLEKLLEGGLPGGAWPEGSPGIDPSWTMVPRWTGLIIKPIWNYDLEVWEETATEDDIWNYYRPEVESITGEYDGYIRELCWKPMVQKEMAGTPIPQAITDEYNRIIAECNDKIQVIWPGATYSRVAQNQTK